MEYITQDMKRFNHLLTEIGAVYHEAALKLGLSDSAMLILYTICNSGDSCLLRDIYHLSGISKQTINSAIRKLEHEGTVHLEVFNGKKKIVHLTEKGKIIAETTVVRIIKMENDIFASWSDEERKLYLDLTHRFLIAMKKETEKL